MADDRGGRRGPTKLVQQPLKLSGSPSHEKSADKTDRPRPVTPADVLMGHDDLTVASHDRSSTPPPLPRSDDRLGPSLTSWEPASSRAPGREAPRPPRSFGAELTDPERTELGRPPPNPVTGRPAGGSLGIVPSPAPSTETTVVSDKRPPPPKPADKPSSGTPVSGIPKLATPDDLGGGDTDLEKEPLLKWIAIGLGLMFFVAIAFAVITFIVLSMVQ